jgi:Tol biopolymer transport system component
MKHFLAIAIAALILVPLRADEATPRLPLIGFTELQTNLPGGRHANVRTSRAVLVRTDGTEHKSIGADLVDDGDAWTQFAGWSPDGQHAIVLRGWQDPVNAQWEEENRTFRMVPGKWLLDSYLVDLQTGSTTNVTAVDRVSHCNSGLFFLPERRGLGFTTLFDGVSKPYVMDLDGHKKRDVSGDGGGFAYGYSASPDGRSISFHENYQLYVANADGTGKRHIQTGHSFDFAPSWSSDSQWLLFVSGEHYNCHPHIVRRNGSGLRKLADRAGYRGVIEFLDVPDFHGGSSDLPAWSVDGKSVFFTANVGESVELFQITLDGTTTQLTKTSAGSLHYHPSPSRDGKLLLFGSKRRGTRNLYVLNLSDGKERPLTDLPTGRAAMWPHWQP